jgi:hypothetical protein
MLRDKELMDALDTVAPLVRQVRLTSFRYPDDAQILWAMSDKSRHHILHYAPAESAAQRFPLFPHLTSVLLDSIRFLHFDHMFACIDFAGTSISSLQIKTVQCSSYSYQSFIQARQSETHASIEELIIEPGSPRLRLEPLLLWIRTMPYNQTLKRFKLAIYDAPDDLQSLLWYLGQPECHVTNLDVQLCSLGEWPRFRE